MANGPPDLSAAPVQVSLERHGVVAILVACRVDERDGAVAGLLAQIGHPVALLLQFGPVPSLKRLPAIRVMAEPFPQPWTGRDVAEPQGEACLLLGQATRPEPIDEDAAPVGSGRFFIGAFELDHRGTP